MRAIEMIKSIFLKPKCNHNYVTVIYPSIFGISKSTECQKCGHRIEGSEKWEK